MSQKQHKVTLNYSTNRNYPLRLMIDRSEAIVLRSGESHFVTLPAGEHEFMLSVSIRKKPLMVFVDSDKTIDVCAPDVFTSIEVSIS